MSTDQIQLGTAKFDARFPNTNQTKNCWQNYVDFHKCTKAKGEDFEPCQYFKKVYASLCPVAWVSLLSAGLSGHGNDCSSLQVEEWDSQREEGTFAGKI